jgi:hypothetical protein
MGRAFLTLFVALLLAHGTAANVADDVGYTALKKELGDALPTGAGVRVTQVEGHAKGPGENAAMGWSPNTEQSDMKSKTFLSLGPASSHATGVASDFYGAGSCAPGVTEIESYDIAWAVARDGFLRPTTDLLPAYSLSRVANHSWIHGHDEPSSLRLLERLDYVVDVDDFIQVGGTNNGERVPDVTVGAYNVIVVGRTDGKHARGTTALGADLYRAGRAKPDIVAPAGYTSNSCPRVASVAAMLVGFAHDSGPRISGGSYVSPRTGLTIWHAETSEVIRAALMAGALRRTANTTAERLGDITDYGRDPATRAANGLDLRYGAGQVNVYNSYHILAAGEQTGEVGPRGFDYCPAFGGEGDAPRQVAYTFTAPDAAARLSASLVWNIHIENADGHWVGFAVLHDLDLALYDLTAGGADPAALSASRVDNTENIWTELTPGHRYELRVLAADGQPEFRWDYGLAWDVVWTTPVE